MLEQFRERVQAEFEPLLTAQIESAKGAFVFLGKVGDGWVRVTEPRAIDAHLKSGREFYRIEVRPPDQRALKEVWERTMGKVVEQMDVDPPPEGVRVVHEVIITPKEGKP